MRPQDQDGTLFDSGTSGRPGKLLVLPEPSEKRNEAQPRDPVARDTCPAGHRQSPKGRRWGPVLPLSKVHWKVQDGCGEFQDLLRSESRTVSSGGDEMTLPFVSLQELMNNSGRC